MATDRQQKPRAVGIRIQPDVDAFLCDLARKTDRSKSWLFHAIIREYRQAVERKMIQPVEMKEKFISLNS